MKRHDVKAMNCLPLLCFLGVAVCLLGACSFPRPGDRQGKVVIFFQHGSKSVVAPVLAPVSYVLSFTGSSTIEPVTTSRDSISVDLPTGSWDIEAVACDASERTIAKGSRDGVTIGTGTTTVALSLSPMQAGAGSIDITFTWPTNLTPPIAEASAILRSQSGLDDLDTLTKAGAELAACSLGYSSQGRASGCYRLVLAYRLEGQPERAFIDDTVVQVFDYLTSTATIAYEKADFDQFPDPPTGLGSTEAMGGVGITWNDTISDVISYKVERSVDGSSWDTLAVDHASTGYADSNAVEGTTYHYRVSAANSVGSSEPGSSTSGSWARPAAGTLAAGAVKSTSIQLSWTGATDNATEASALQYRVVRSTSGNVGTVADATANGTVAVDWSAALLEASATGLSPSATYWFNVLVRDAAGNTAAYVQISATTAASSITRIIDHTCFDPSGYSDAQIQAAAALKVYFEHASTGQDITGNSSTDSSVGRNNDNSADCGLALLYAYDAASARYLCDRYHIPEGGTNYPGWFDTHNGLQTFRRGNPAPATKLSDFVGMSDAMRTAIDVAMFKFCWIDVHPDNGGYITEEDASGFAASMISDMESFEAANPGLVVVYWTMPVERDVAYAARQTFNEAIRAYCTANGKWLMDIADIESHDPSGAASVDVNGWELACSGYTTEDGGHLDQTGSIRMARAYWSLLAEIAKAMAAGE